jgi:hypothetical protein
VLHALRHDEHLTHHEATSDWAIRA